MPSKYVTISIKLPREIKEKLEKAGIKPGKIAKEAILNAAEEIEIQELKMSINEIKKSLEKVPIERIVEGVREDRER